MNAERRETLLQTIDKLGVTTIKQLSAIHTDLGTYRNACRIVNQLSPYINMDRQQQKIIYLNKNGRQLIGSDKEVKKSIQMEHKLFCNEAYIYFNCPLDWKTEYRFEHESEITDILIQINGGKTKIKKSVVADAMFNRNGYLNFVEIDNTRHMIDNQKKIEKYREVLKLKKVNNAKIYFFTSTNIRKNKLNKWLNGLNHEVLTFDEIK